MKKCKANDCPYDQFGGGYCRKHGYLRTDKTIKPFSAYRSTKPLRSSKPLKRPNKPIKKITYKKQKEKQELLKKDRELYNEIWEEEHHVCYDCNRPLGDEARLYYFHHILEKGRQIYKHLRHQKRNICLLCFDCHGRVTNGVLSNKMRILTEDTIKYFQKIGLLK